MTLHVLNLVAGNVFGGVETFMVTTSQGRACLGDCDFEYGLCFDGRLKTELEALGSKVHMLGEVRARNPLAVVAARRRLKSLLLANRYDLVVGHMAWMQALFAGVVRSCNLAYVAHMHSPRDESWPERWSRKTAPDFLIAPSKHSLEDQQRLFPVTASGVLNYPLPLRVTDFHFSSEDRRAQRDALGATDRDIVVLQATRIDRWKGPDRTLLALAKLKDEPGWMFWLAGGAQRPEEIAYMNELKEIARSQGLENRVRFLGQRTDVNALMRSADIYCQGNRWGEGFSLSFLEASYSGLPIVTTDLGGASEMIGPENGILVPPGEPVDELAEGLRQLIKDRPRRLEMGSEATRKAIRLSDATQQLEKLSHYYQQAVNLHRDRLSTVNSAGSAQL